MTAPENFSGPLHSLRGIAALVVVLAHAWIPVARFGSPTALFLSLFNSGSAVSLFFVLSGLVLALSFDPTIYWGMPNMQSAGPFGCCRYWL